MSTDLDVNEIRARLVEAQEAERYASDRVKTLTEALAAATIAKRIPLEADQGTQLEAKLEHLSWKEAASRKCDYVRDAPLELVERVRTVKGGIKGQTHHFTTSSTEPTLFRFKRSVKV